MQQPSFVAKAEEFFKLVETGKGASAIAGFLKTPGSQRFECQAPALADVHDIKTYADWMANLCSGIAPDASYELHNVAVDQKNRFLHDWQRIFVFVDAFFRSVVFFATFRGTHTGEKGPMKPTKKEVESHYVYVIRFDANKDEIISMTKIWNDNYAFKQLSNQFFFVVVVCCLSNKQM